MITSVAQHPSLFIIKHPSLFITKHPSVAHHQTPLVAHHQTPLVAHHQTPLSHLTIISLQEKLSPLKRTVENIKDPLYRFFEREVNIGRKLLSTVLGDLTDISQVRLIIPPLCSIHVCQNNNQSPPLVLENQPATRKNRTYKVL